MKQNKAGHEIHIDIPIVLKEKSYVVFNMDHLAFAGDMPIGIKYMKLLSDQFKEQATKGQIIGIFHGDASYMPLNDKAYNAYRNVRTGNPYKIFFAEMITQEVQIEECAVSMENHHWLNGDLLPGVKVHSGAIARLIQLMQEDYVQIHP
jgi:intracellular sulfur oxidation DsrE/DsrF family protein